MNFKSYKETTIWLAFLGLLYNKIDNRSKYHCIKYDNLTFKNIWSKVTLT